MANCDTSAIKTAQTAYDDARTEWSVACTNTTTAESALQDAQATYDAALAAQQAAKINEAAAWTTLEDARNGHVW